MKVFVCLKQVPDTAARLSIAGGTDIDEAGIDKWVINPFDEYAIEEAVRLKEARQDVEVVLLCLGPERSAAALRTALAMGADREIFILSERRLDHHLTARALAAAIEQDGGCDLIFTGKQAVDDDGHQVHLRLAFLLGLPAATDVITFSLAGDRASVEREIEEGARERIELDLPALVAVTRGINEPRYPSLKQIIKARGKELRTLSLADLGGAGPPQAGPGRVRPRGAAPGQAGPRQAGLAKTPRFANSLDQMENQLQIVALSLPPEKQAGRVLAGEKEQVAAELVHLLQSQAKVL